MLYVNPISNAALFRPDGTPDGAGRRTVALQELEHFFAYSLLQEMRKSIPEDGLLDGGPQRRMFNEMLDDTLSGAMAKSGQLGLARQIEEQLRAAETQAKLASAATRNGAESEGLPLAAPRSALPLMSLPQAFDIKRAREGLPLNQHKGLRMIQSPSNGADK